MWRRMPRVLSFAHACWISGARPELQDTGLPALLKARLFRNRAHGDSRRPIPPHGGPHPIRAAGLEFLKTAENEASDENNESSIFHDSGSVGLCGGVAR